MVAYASAQCHLLKKTKHGSIDVNADSEPVSVSDPLAKSDYPRRNRCGFVRRRLRFRAQFRRFLFK
jgi:hypothetical protein